MPYLRMPERLATTTVQAQEKWLKTYKAMENLVKEDFILQNKAEKGFRLKGRTLPVEVIGRFYAQYCDLLNRLYDAYLNNLQLQRVAYLKEIVQIIVKRLFELRNELVHLIVNDYIYVDGALVQLQKTPYDIEIIVPYHFAVDSRPDSMEYALQTMWRGADHRLRFPPKVKKPKVRKPDDDDDEAAAHVEEEEVIEVTPAPSVHTVIPDDYIHALTIQRHERYRVFYRKDFRAKCAMRLKFMVVKPKDEPLYVRTAAAALIQKVYRQYMCLKRKKLLDIKRDVILGMMPEDPCASLRATKADTDKIYANRRRKRSELLESYQKDIEREKTRLLFFKKDDQIEDITVHVWEWFKEWYKGYGFFPEFPFPLEGGTVLVIRGDYNTIEEKEMQDELEKKAKKGKTKEQLKLEKEKAKEDALLKAQILKEKLAKEALNYFKMRCYPPDDPGYLFKSSDADIGVVLRNYAQAWSFNDKFPPDRSPETVFGYMMSVLTEDLMVQLHKDCRAYVDELRRLDLQLLIKAQKRMWARVGWVYPKFQRKRPPKAPQPTEPFNVDDDLLKLLEPLFDAKLISKPTAKMNDICGDMNFAAYEYNIKDPDASFPLPGYGDVKRRLVYSCIFGCGLEETAVRNKSVMLLGQERNGKSFLVDAVAGEINAIKIDISPEVFTGKKLKPGPLLPRVLLAARAFQPAVIFFRNIERAYYKKVPHEERRLKPTSIKNPLEKLLKLIDPNDKIIFIATCSDPWAAKVRPLVKIFREIILVPRVDYGTARQFFYDKFLRVRSLPHDACETVQPLAQLLQGYGFGVLMQTYDYVMTPERIVAFNHTPLSPLEFLEPLIENGIDPISVQDFNMYTEFYIKYSPLKTEREEYAVINKTRGIVYAKLSEKKEKDAKKAEAAK